MLTLDLKGKTAIVTGATGQLGRTIAARLAQCGADVVLCYHAAAQKAEELKSKIEAEYGVRAFAAQLDIRKLDSVYALRDLLSAQFALPDIVVCCAVSQYRWTTILEQDMADYQDQFETTVMHNVAMIKVFVPELIKKGWGRVIGINTECSMQCFPTQSAYIAGKRGMDGVYRVLAQEIGASGITVNQVAPGWTISDRERENGIEDGNESYSEAVPLRRRGTDEDIANAVAFLASELAGFITGVYLPVCGGNVMPSI